MSVSNTIIQLKKSGISGNTPTSLNYGEIALNWADGKLYYKNGTGIKFITNQKTFSTINANNTLILAGSYTDTLNFVGNNGIVIAGDAINNKITISYDGAGGATGATGSAGPTGPTGPTGPVGPSGNGGGGSSIYVSTPTGNTSYVPLINQTTGSLSYVYTDGVSLIYDIANNILNTQGLSVTQNVVFTSNTSYIKTTNQVVLDSFDSTVYRSAFYNIDMENGTNYHVLNLNILNYNSSALSNTYGEIYNSSNLGTFTANVANNIVNVLYTPTLANTSVSFTKKLIKSVNTKVVLDDLGYIYNSPVVFYDAGFVTDSPTAYYDFGTV